MGSDRAVPARANVRGSRERGGGKRTASSAHEGRVRPLQLHRRRAGPGDYRPGIVGGHRQQTSQLTTLFGVSWNWNQKTALFAVSWNWLLQADTLGMLIEASRGSHPAATSSSSQQTALLSLWRVRRESLPSPTRPRHRRAEPRRQRRIW